MKNHIKSILGVSSFAILVASMPQIAAAQDTSKKAAKEEVVIVTGSSIKRKVLDNALPLQIITAQDLKRDGIASVDQLMQSLTVAGNGMDNLAANADVVSGAQRGTNGLSSANLRGQGNQGTLVLLNGRRISSYGLSGSAVDLNQIPFTALQRVDVLKDGASAIYGTDAVGGVINFITRENFEGLNLRVGGDVTEHGGGNIAQTALTAGYGNLAEQHFNVMGTLSFSKYYELDASDRDFINTIQPEMGISPDTRGTPYATIFPRAGSFFASSSAMPFIPGSTSTRISAANPLALVGGAGCTSGTDMAPYDYLLWGDTAGQNRYACTYDTGKHMVLQQPVKNTNFLGRAVYKIGDHKITAEVLASRVDSDKKFSENQLSSNTTTANFLYPLNSLTQTTYDAIYHQLLNTFTDSASQALITSGYGKGLAVRWRCDMCGPRQISTRTDSGRYFLGADGPMGDTEWSYRTGASYSFSESKSTLGDGYYFSYDNVANGCDGSNTGIFCVLNSGIINVFLPTGQKQSQAAVDALAKASAKGVVLYGGRFSVTEVDGSASGPLFDLPGGKMYAAVGFDLRREDYRFNGDIRAAAAQRAVYNAPFDNSNALAAASRGINAIYAEIDMPLFKGFDLTVAGRMDDYDGFGSTTNPKITVKYKPIKQVMFRGSYNTAFRVPTFNQLFNGVIESPYTSTTFADPKTCPGGLFKSGVAGCEAVTFNYLSGGRQDLGPETAKEGSFGVVFTPNDNYSASLDWWKIDRKNTIQLYTLNQLFTNYSLFPEYFIYDSTGKLAQVDQRYINGGEQITEGLELTLSARGDIYKGKWSAGLEGSYLIDKKEKLLASAPTWTKEVGVWTPAGDLGLRWKHNLHVTYTQGDWSGTLSQIFRSSYKDQVYSTTYTAPNGHTKTDDYIIYNASVVYKGLKNFEITGGIKNLLDTDPPFAYAYYSPSGSNSNWEPRVADPRGRSYTLIVEYKF